MYRCRLLFDTLDIERATSTHERVRFNRGLNVVVGASNTGKTYIAQCVDFMLGGSRSPKEIPEVVLMTQYTSVFVAGPRMMNLPSNEAFVAVTSDSD